MGREAGDADAAIGLRAAVFERDRETAGVAVRGADAGLALVRTVHPSCDVRDRRAHQAEVSPACSSWSLVSKGVRDGSPLGAYRLAGLNATQEISARSGAERPHEEPDRTLQEEVSIWVFHIP